MSEYVSDADVGHGYFRENEESEQHRLFEADVDGFLQVLNLEMML